MVIVGGASPIARSALSRVDGLAGSSATIRVGACLELSGLPCTVGHSKHYSYFAVPVRSNPLTILAFPVSRVGSLRSLERQTLGLQFGPRCTYPT